MSLAASVARALDRALARRSRLNIGHSTSHRKIGGQWYYDPKGEAREFPPGRANWYGRDPMWKDTLGFRGKEDVERPVWDDDEAA